MPEQNAPGGEGPLRSALASQKTITMLSERLDGDGATAILGSPDGERDEIIRLKRLLAEKDHAIMRAALSAQELQQQLSDEQQESLQLRTELAAVREAEGTSQPVAGTKGQLSPEAQAEIDKQRKEWLRVQKSLEREHNNRKAELAQIRAQWFQTQQQLEAQTRARRMESAQASASIARLERELSSANSSLSRAYAAGSGSSRVKRFMAVATACLTLMLGAGLVWNHFPARAGTLSVSNPSAGSTAASTAQVQSVRPAIASTPVTAAGFQGSLSRLNRALASFGNRPPEEIMRAARKRMGDPSLCAFEWNKGQPALLYSSGGLNASLASALTRCAVAVEQMH